MDDNDNEGEESHRAPLISPDKSPRKRKRKTHMKKVARRKKRHNEGCEYTTNTEK